MCKQTTHVPQISSTLPKNPSHYRPLGTTRGKTDIRAGERTAARRNSVVKERELRPCSEALITKAYWVLRGEWVKEKPATEREEERLEETEAGG